MAMPQSITLATDKAAKWTKSPTESKTIPGWLIAKFAAEAAERKAKAIDLQEAADRAKVQMKASYQTSKAFLKAARKAERDGTVEW